MDAGRKFFCDPRFAIREISDHLARCREEPHERARKSYDGTNSPDNLSHNRQHRAMGQVLAGENVALTDPSALRGGKVAANDVIDRNEIRASVHVVEQTSLSNIADNLSPVKMNIAGPKNHGWVHHDGKQSVLHSLQNNLLRPVLRDPVPDIVPVPVERRRFVRQGSIGGVTDRRDGAGVDQFLDILPEAGADDVACTFDVDRKHLLPLLPPVRYHRRGMIDDRTPFHSALNRLKVSHIPDRVLNGECAECAQI